MGSVFVVDGDWYKEREPSSGPLLLLGLSHASSKWRKVAIAILKSIPRARFRVNTTVGRAGSPFRGRAISDCRLQILDFRFRFAESRRPGTNLKSEIDNLKSEIGSTV
jgi:hypothetical protein